MSIFPVLYLNENIQVSLVNELTKLNLTAVHTYNANNGGVTDEFQLQYAAAKQYVLVSYNRRHYRKLHNEWQHSGKSHYGIIILSPGEPEYVAKRIKLFLEHKYPSLIIPFCEVPPVP
ncbi:MAG: DUF5615 family PIN-like protein [Candidatus Omnitrophota bacterium]